MSEDRLALLEARIRELEDKAEIGALIHRYAECIRIRDKRACQALLLDEPTASLDAVNREVVLSLIEGAKARGAAIIGIFHDEAARDRLCDRLVDVRQFTPGAQA